MNDFKVPYDFKGKVALVTGAASRRGMGHAVALGLAKGGADVAVCDKFEAPPSLYAGDENWKGLIDVVAEIKGLGRKSWSTTADVSKSKDVNDLVAKTLDKLGKIDILINAAGMVGKRDVPVLQLSEEDFRAPIEVNLVGSFLISKAVATHMVKRNHGGKMVHFSSIQAKRGVPGVAGYSSSKFGVIGFVQSLALELAQYKINVNCVCPGFIATNLRDDQFEAQSKALGISPDEARKKRYDEKASQIPLGRSGIAEDVAKIVLFLASEQSDYMTGQAINVSGGYVMN
jgi:NAD(P)-dependent dehydrogenase (short-subunit alcohol dehydrogenase family)